tara:strand:+ start:156 stop:797 length:642 start_codon:yes stop_codon:yes gene_type:complete
MIPKVLKDIENYLKNFQIEIAEKIEGEHRVSSLKDEGTVKSALRQNKKLKPHILDVPPRGFGDMVVLDYDMKTEYVVNIKTSIGSSDNCFSKIGFVYCLTDLEPQDLPKSMNFLKMNELIETHKADVSNKDYYFLCVDKNDSSNVLVRGAKQISNWTVNINQSNVLQINWKKEKKSEPTIRTWDESYEVLMGGVKKSINGFLSNVPREWINEN